MMSHIVRFNPPIPRFDYGNPKHYFLTNFAKYPLVYRGTKFWTSEAAYQAQKTLVDAEYKKIMAVRDPGIAKYLGQQATMRKDWNEIKLRVMREILAIKFVEGKLYAQKLIATKDAQLIEGNTWHDRIWGVYEGRGLNWLGKLLMERRDFLQGMPFIDYFDAQDKEVEAGLSGIGEFGPSNSSAYPKFVPDKWGDEA